MNVPDKFQSSFLNVQIKVTVTLIFKYKKHLVTDV